MPYAPNQPPKYQVYKITNLMTGKCYIGYTSQRVEIRFLRHKKEARTGSPYAIHSAIRKYGPHNFIIEILSRHYHLEEAIAEEINQIKLQNSITPYGYNLTPGGCHYPMTEATKAKLRSMRLGTKMSEETKAKISNSLKQSQRSKHPCDEATKILLSLIHKNLNAQKRRNGRTR